MTSYRNNDKNSRIFKSNRYLVPHFIYLPIRIIVCLYVLPIRIIVYRYKEYDTSRILNDVKLRV